MRNGYLTQGLVLVTLGLMTNQLSDSIKAPIFAAQSVVLLALAIRIKDQVLQAGAIVAAALAFGYAISDSLSRSEDFLLSGLFVGAFLLFNAWQSHRALESNARPLLRPRVLYFTGLAVGVCMIAVSIDGMQRGTGWLPVSLIGMGGALAASVYWLRVREFVLLGQVPAAFGLASAIEAAGSVAEFDWALAVALAMALGLAHWWGWQRERLISCCADPEEARPIARLAEGVFSGGVILMLLVWIYTNLEMGSEWLVLGSLMSVGIAIYGLLTRAPFVAVFAQVFLAMACLVQVDICLTGSPDHSIRALVPIATLLLTNLVLSGVSGRLVGPVQAIEKVIETVQCVYRLVAGGMGLLWIMNFVADDYRVLVSAVVGVLLLLANSWKPAREWYWLALAYVGAGALYLCGEFAAERALAQSVVAIFCLFGAQQLARRRDGIEIPEMAHQSMILGGGIALFIWATIKLTVSLPELDVHGVRSITWAILAVIYFSLGLKLRERWYRLMGLGTLAVALVSLFPIIWQMSTELKIASFFVLGLVFVGTWVGVGLRPPYRAEQIFSETRCKAAAFCAATSVLSAVPRPTNGSKPPDVSPATYFRNPAGLSSACSSSFSGSSDGTVRRAAYPAMTAPIVKSVDRFLESI